MTWIIRSCAAAVALVAASWLGSGSTSAQDDEAADGTVSRCVSTGVIDSTLVLDDQTILFFTRGDRVYRNTLPRTCRDLARANSSFTYRTTASRLGPLCASDEIVVSGSGFVCKLGQFELLSAEEVERLRSGEPAAPDSRSE